MRFVTASLLLLFAAPLAAQTPGNCAPSTAQASLDVSNVLAQLFNGGNLFFGNATTSGDGYIVPKFSGNSSIYAANLWVGGMVDDEIRVASASFGNFEFWPGPLEDGATLPNPDDCSAYDRIWVVSALDVEAYDDTGVATADLAEWPVEFGAEVVDGDGNPDNYDLAGGDRPRVLGSQTAFWVMNDVGNTHVRTQSKPIGVEVQVTAFAVASEDDAFDQATFYRVHVVNRNTLALEGARFTFLADTDLGRAGDEYQGVDTLRALGYYYNANATDEAYGVPPAAGFDFLNTGLGSFQYAINGVAFPLNDPILKEEVYRTQRGLWSDGTPLTAAGNGYMTSGPETVWAFPGDPVTGEGWNGISAGVLPANQRIHPSSPAFDLAPGEAKTFDVAFLFAQGTDHLDSVTELRAASDRVQAAYDDGSLFQTKPTVSTLPAPVVLTPADGAFLSEPFAWEPVPGAEGYTLRFFRDPERPSYRTIATTKTETTVGFSRVNVLDTVYWQVRAEAPGDHSPFSEPRSFQRYQYEFDRYADGTAIVETARPDDAVCPDGTDDPGCTGGYPGNTVWLSPNADRDYVLTQRDNELGGALGILGSAAGAIEDESFEIRFTEACAVEGACLAVYAQPFPLGTNAITSVPFELWSTGESFSDDPGVAPSVDDPADDVRMIPSLLLPEENSTPLTAWVDAFPTSHDVVVRRRDDRGATVADTLLLPVTHGVSGVMPDRPGGYERFAEAALAFGGPGATYDPAADGDDQEDTNPANGQPCRSQGYFADFCWRGDNPRVVAPIGGIFGAEFADLAGDGTTPPVGTVVRFHANARLSMPVSAEDDASSAPGSTQITAAWPNPFRSSATVTYELERSADVSVAVYDVLGRQVATLAEGRREAGPHTARLDGRGLASGVYVVVLEAEGEQHSRKLLLLR